MTAYSSSPGLLYARNRALNANPSPAYYHVTSGGSDLNWAIMTLNALLLLGVLAWTFITSSRRRVFHYFSIGILLIGTIYYFIIASDLGSSAVFVEFGRKNLTRQVFYARWVGYSLNFSLIMFAILLLSGVGWATILFTTGLTLGWGVMFLIGMFVRTTYKWGFFVFAYFLYFLIVWQVLGVGRRFINKIDTTAHRSYTMLALWPISFMILYTISWAVSEGSNHINNDREQVFYAVLDVCAQCLFALALLALTRGLDFDLLRLGFSDYGRVSSVHHEKRMHNGGTAHGEQAPVAPNGAGSTTGGAV